MNELPMSTNLSISRRRLLQAAGAGAVAASTPFVSTSTASAATHTTDVDQSLITSFIGVAQAYVPDTYELGRELGASWARAGAGWARAGAACNLIRTSR